MKTRNLFVGLVVLVAVQFSYSQNNGSTNSHPHKTEFFNSFVKGVSGLDLGSGRIIDFQKNRNKKNQNAQESPENVFWAYWMDLYALLSELWEDNYNQTPHNR